MGCFAYRVWRRSGLWKEGFFCYDFDVGVGVGEMAGEEDVGGGGLILCRKVCIL